MLRLFIALLSGSFFGAGLFVSGMTDTAKVQGWLDVFGNWDPTLAFVMGGAMIPMGLAWALSRRHVTSLSGQPLPPLPSREIDTKLILGSVFFGICWGLVGLCPGPAIASLTYGGPGLYIFVAAMLGGMLMAPAARRQLDRAVPAE